LTCPACVENTANLDRATRRRTLSRVAGLLLFALTSVACILIGVVVSVGLNQPVRDRAAMQRQLPAESTTPSSTPSLGGGDPTAPDAVGMMEYDGSRTISKLAALNKIRPLDDMKDSPDQPSIPLAVIAGPWPTVKMKHVIGATTTVLETQTELSFQARVDTGAKSCSMHVEKIVIADVADEMEANIGKQVRFKVKNTEGESDWINSVIERCINVKTSDSVERRYKVPLL
jgi:hypothetical protein